MSLAQLATDTATAADTLPGRRAHTITRLAQLLSRRLPTTLEALRCELTANDGYPTTASGADQGPRAKGGIGRPTETTVLTRLGHRDDGPATDQADLYETVVGAHDAIRQAHTRTGIDRDDWLDVCISFLRQAHRTCDHWTAPNDPNAARNHRCRGTGDADGATCQQIADYRYRPDGTIDDLDHRCPDCRAAVEEREAAEAAAREARRLANASNSRRARRYA